MKSANLLCWVLLIGCCLSCAEKPAPGKQVLIKEGFSNKVLDAYWLYLPANYHPGKKWPLIMFLQGGDAGASPNPNTVRDGGPFGYIRQPQMNLPDSFIIINPHMRTGPRERRQWFENANGLIQMINKTIQENNADPNRIYLTGQSRGGHGTWGVAKRYPAKFAALVPIAGALGCKTNCEEIAKIPMWILHNDGDPVVKYEYPQTTVAFLEDQVGMRFLRTSDLAIDQDMLDSKAIFTTFASDQHGGAGAKAYSSTVLYEWLLDQSRTSKKR